MAAKLFAADSVETFAEFERTALGVADALRERGVGPGVRVLLKAGNSPGYLAGLFGLMHLGASIVLVDHQERAEQTRRICEQAAVKVTLVDDDAPLPDGENPVYLYELLVAATARPATESALDFDTWRDQPDGLVMWSSGSTGEPKGVVKNGGRFLDNLRRNADQVGHRADDVLLPLLPFNHQYGLSMVLIAWLARCSLVIAPYRRLDKALRMAGQCGATVVDATPATYRSMLNIVTKRPEAAEDLSTVRMFCSGAAPLPPALVDSYVQTFGLPLLDSYGSTELGNLAFATTENPVGCGRVMAGLRLRVVDEDGNTVRAGEIGELLVDCPDMMAGYLGPDGVLAPVEQGWYATNDFGYLDADDNLFVVGRKLAVHRNGYTLFPEIIENKVAAHGCSAKVIALPDDRRGCQLVFFVEDDHDRDAAHWRAVINDVLPAWEQPNRVHVLGAFPLNRNGKPDRQKMEKLAAELAA
ncbi:class I adenylate-forming enzyme family protein [Kutzneria kofuensis]|uniref:Acyl-CoA synthetase (AMP-forming)/AMP-acid ligase II n=1 Tax=Kutzneria kofuensis TaxID=103725 RepID=A0A7W9KFR6_9PSEU|nr:class I adenylate-forming enzyme family protein [Kutzneria kofuensis]MBB5891318.1 acyl-CoA synthetase (AMP-forming)/AMP-acid ligase II [Kutzneria kofuensis]